MANIKAPKNGYVYIYLSNQSNNYVYFDDFKVNLIRGRIVEENHYYAYGLKIAGISSKRLSLSSGNGDKNNYLYQGAFAELDEDIGWTDFDLRNYDAQIGRWIQQDPYQEYASAYLGMGNDPVNLIDPSGGRSLASITGSTNILLNTAATTIGGAFVGGIVGMFNGDENAWKKGAAIGAAVGLAVSFKADINVLFDIFKTGLQIENRIIGRSLNDLGDKLIDAEDKLNRKSRKDRDDFKNHFGVDDDNSMDLIKGMVLREQNLVKEYLKKRTYKNKIKRTNVYGPETFAFVNAADPNHNVNLEPAFWKAPRKGQDSKMGTMAHELSHFNDIGGTGDNGDLYGTLEARNRALNRPSDALKTADSFEYYIEKVRLK